MRLLARQKLLTCSSQSTLAESRSSSWEARWMVQVRVLSQEGQCHSSRQTFQAERQDPEPSALLFEISLFVGTWKSARTSSRLGPSIEVKKQGVAGSLCVLAPFMRSLKHHLFSLNQFSCHSWLFGWIPWFSFPRPSNRFHCRFAYSEGGLWDLRVDRSIGTAVRNKSWIIMFGIVSLLAGPDHNRVDRCLCFKSSDDHCF